MSRLEAQIREAAARIPLQLTTAVLRNKLADAGAADPQGGAEAMAAHLFAGTGQPFQWPAGSVNAGVSIEVTPSETRDLIEEIARFTDETLPVVLRKTTRKTAQAVVRQILRRWDDQQDAILDQQAGFELGLAAWWGDAIDLLRILLMSSREVGDAFLRRDRRRRSERDRLRNGVLTRLHARACQVVGEIIVLLEAGYADGAFARWRTLHEITVVAVLIADHGDPLAERYLAHEAVDLEKAAGAFDRVRLSMGRKPLYARDRARTRKAYKAALATYGLGFEEQYGWAATLRDGKRCTFDDLEGLAGRSALRLHYKLASHAVHAGQRAIRNPLSGPPTVDLILAGPSHKGIEEAGVLAAYTLTALTSLLFPRRVGIRSMVELETFVILRDKAETAFARTARQINCGD
jgi:hypothetical protein